MLVVPACDAIALTMCVVHLLTIRWLVGKYRNMTSHKAQSLLLMVKHLCMVSTIHLSEILGTQPRTTVCKGCYVLVILHAEALPTHPPIPKQPPFTPSSGDLSVCVAFDLPGSTNKNI